MVAAVTSAPGAHFKSAAATHTLDPLSRLSAKECRTNRYSTVAATSPLRGAARLQVLGNAPQALAHPASFSKRRPVRPCTVVGERGRT